MGQALGGIVNVSVPCPIPSRLKQCPYFNVTVCNYRQLLFLVSLALYTSILHRSFNKHIYNGWKWQHSYIHLFFVSVTQANPKNFVTETRKYFYQRFFHCKHKGAISAQNFCIPNEDTSTVSADSSQQQMEKISYLLTDQKSHERSRVHRQLLRQQDVMRISLVP